MAVLMRDCWQVDAALRPKFQEIGRRLASLDAETVSPGSFQTSLQASKQRDRRTKELLYDLFPKHVAEALREGRKVEAEAKDPVTIFFSDIVGFTDISSTLEPHKVSRMLDELYSKFDALTDELGVFKVETIGDAYMAVTNLVSNQEHDHAKRIAQFAIRAIEVARTTLIDPDNPEKGRVNIRVGFHSGPIVANVVGSRNLRYCLFGDTVNTASRMESTSIKNHIHCSATAAKYLLLQAPEIPLFSRGMRQIKGKGEMETFWVQSTPAGD
jgi:class 3 adenylate cyclase